MSDPASLLSPSGHVELLVHYQLTHETHASMPGPNDHTVVHTLMASPQPVPPTDASSDPATLLKLPRGWDALRRQQLRLPSEKRMMAGLTIDTQDSHLLRRGLWLACASMFLPQLLNAEHLLQKEDDADADSTVAASASSGGSSASSELEGVGDLRVPPSFTVSVVTGGITNQLYQASLSSHPEQPVLVRIYGPRTELVIDRSKESDVVDVLSASGEGPRIWGRFANGRLEGWLVGKSISPAQMREPHMSALIAATLSRLHYQQMPFAREPVIASVLRKWATIAAEVSFPEDANKRGLLTQLNLPDVIASTHAYIDEVQRSHYGSASAIVFAHNDLLSGNVMYDSVRDTVALVDFGQVQGNMCARYKGECCGFECEWSQFPSRDAQAHFLRAYLAAVQSVPVEKVLDVHVQAAYAEVQCWLLGPHLFWTLWAVVQAKYSPIDFDYLSYALQRWQAFHNMQPHARKWMAVTPDTLDSAFVAQPQKL